MMQAGVQSARNRKNDIIYTPLEVAKKMIEMCNISPEMKVLDPCYGEGVFYENLPECKKAWCEIEKGVDFFEMTERFDCIIGNPPYSKWNAWLDKTMELTDKFCYIMGNLNISTPRFNRIIENGYGITQMHLLKIDWWFGTSWIVMFEKNKPSIISLHPHTVFCPECSECKTRCKRGREDNSPNVCCYVEKPPKPVKEAKEKKPRKKSGSLAKSLNPL